MKLGKILQIIGYVFFGIGVLARIVSRLSDGEISEILSDYQLLKFVGFVFWIIGFAIIEMGKRKLKNKTKNEINSTSTNQS